MRHITLRLLHSGLAILSFLMPVGAVAQSKVIYTLTGQVEMSGQSLKSYTVSYAKQGNRISGYTITGDPRQHGLKAAMRGILKTDSLFITETGTLDPLARNLPGSIYCFFSAVLVYKENISGRKGWAGVFKGFSEDGAPCGGGNMVLFENEKTPLFGNPTPAKPLPVTTPEPAVKPLPITMPPAISKPPPADTANYHPLYLWNTDSLRIEIWDGFTVDGDVVSLEYNNLPLLNHQKLTAEKLHFTLPVTGHGIQTITIPLWEEGFERPNTPNITLYDGMKQHAISISGSYGEVAHIYIRRK